MDNDFLTIFYESEGIPPQPRKLPLDLKAFTKEIAFHEASHFVMGRLINKLNIGFREATSITIDSRGKKSGVVTGFGGSYDMDTPYWTESNKARFEAFYSEDVRRIWAESLNLIAGYASYKLFISDQEDFISYLETSESTEVVMHTLSTVPHHFRYTPGNKEPVGVNDFAKIRDRLSFIEIVDKEERVEVYNSLLEVACKIMKIRAVEYAIRYIKNRLIAYDGKIIEGDYFKHITEVVERGISKVDISSFVEYLYKNPKK